MIYTNIRRNYLRRMVTLKVKPGRRTLIKNVGPKPAEVFKLIQYSFSSIFISFHSVFFLLIILVMCKFASDGGISR